MNNSTFTYRLYGRIKGRSKKNINIDDYFHEIEKYKLKKTEFNKINILDIGTGYGETSIFFSKKYIEKKIVACENYINGNLNLIKNIKENQLTNLNIYNGNVNELLDQNIPCGNIDIVNISFPDPWPKCKHKKRRLINLEFLNKIHGYMSANSKIYISTDSTDYLEQIYYTIYHISHKFYWENRNSDSLRYDDYGMPHTKYYKKAIISGRKPTFLILKKI